MGNPLVDVAIKGLELIGVNIPPSASYLVEQIINDGLDAVEEIPKIISTIEALGGEAWTMLDEIAVGMASYGPAGYVQSLLHQKIDPHVQTIHAIHTQKQTLSTLHRTMLTDYTTQVQSLSPTQASLLTAYTGVSADAMRQSFSDVSGNTSKLLDYLDQSQQIDQDFFQQVEIALIVGAAIMIVTLILIAAGLLAELVVAVLATPFTFGLSDVALVGVGGGTLAGGLGLLGEEAAAVLAAILVLFVIWAARHQILNWQYHISTRGTINLAATSEKGLQYPKLNKPQAKAVDDLAKELGLDFPAGRAALEYLIGTMCKLGGLSVAQAMDIVRCLQGRGWLKIAPPGQPSDNYGRAWNFITHNLEPDDLQGAWKDLRNIPVIINGRPYTHVQKVDDA